MARSAWRRVERFALGIAFGVMAWFIERRVLKAIRRKGLMPPKASMAEETTSEVERPLP